MSASYEDQLRRVLASTPTSEFISAMNCYTHPDDMVRYVQLRYQLLESMERSSKPLTADSSAFGESTTRSGKVFRRQMTKTS